MNHRPAMKAVTVLAPVRRITLVLAMTLASAFVLAGCGGDTVVAGSDEDSGSGSGSGAEPESVDTTQPVLDAVMEPLNSVVDNFGGEWELVDQWFTEGPEVTWDTGCEAFDALGVMARSGPETSVWTTGQADLVHRVQSLEFEADGYGAQVGRVAEACPTLPSESGPVRLTAIDPAVFGDLVSSEGVSASAFGLDAFPVANRETDVASPSFEPDRPTWQVVLVRHNVVSQLTYSPRIDAEVDADVADPPQELIQAVSLAWERLAASPVDAEGPFERPGPPPTAGDQIVDRITLYLGFECFESSAITVDGVRFGLIDPLPIEWRGLIEVDGRATITGEMATFTAEDGTTLRLTSGAQNSSCTFWEPENAPPPDDDPIGRLPCPASTTIESRHPDEGQGHEALARAEVPGTAALEQENALISWALDSDGNVLAGIFLGDADGADYQIFRCSES